MDCWVHRAVAKRRCCRASLEDGDWIPERSGCWAVVLDRRVRACRDRELATCRRKSRCTVNLRFERLSSTLGGFTAWRPRTSTRKSTFSWNCFSCRTLRGECVDYVSLNPIASTVSCSTDSWKIWAAVNKDEWVWPQHSSTNRSSWFSTSQRQALIRFSDR